MCIRDRYHGTVPHRTMVLYHTVPWYCTTPYHGTVPHHTMVLRIVAQREKLEIAPPIVAPGHYSNRTFQTGFLLHNLPKVFPKSSHNAKWILKHERKRNVAILKQFCDCITVMTVIAAFRLCGEIQVRRGATSKHPCGGAQTPGQALENAWFVGEILEM